MTDPNKSRRGYKRTKVGWIPKDWQCVHLGEAFRERTVKGSDGLPIYSVTMDQGLVPRSTLDRKMAPDIDAEASLLVEKGDIAYNMMRMWQGAVAVAETRCVVSPAYVVCRPTPQVHPQFMLRYFKSHIGLHQLWAYSHGITGDRLRLYYGDFEKVPAPLPPYAEQAKIAAILATCDSATQRTSNLIVIKREQKKALLQRLLTGKKRLPGFKEKWTIVTLGEITTRLRDATETPGDYPVLSMSAGIGFVSQEDKFSKVIAGKQVENYVRLKRGEFAYNKGNSHRYPQGCVYQLTEYEEGLVPDVFYSFKLDNKRADPEFIKQYFLAGLHNKDLYRWINSGVRNNGLLNLSASDFFNLPIQLPGLSEQKEIGRVMKAADDEINALASKLMALKEQKKGLMQKLLTGQLRVKV